MALERRSEIPCPGTIKAADRGVPRGKGRGARGPADRNRRAISRNGYAACRSGCAAWGRAAGPAAPSARLILLVALIALVAWFALGSFYTVQPNEIGINLVFGRYTGKTAAGLNANWPWPLGEVIKVPVSDQQITEVGYHGDPSSADILAESQMLTGDQNIVNVRFRVSWQIDPAHPEDYVFNILNPRETVKAVAESIMREVVGLKTIDGVLTSDRKSIEPDVQNRMQTVLNNYHAGVLVKQVQLQSVDAPSQVISAYRDVTAAQQDQQRAVNDAETYANSVVPEAEGRASRILAEANAYKQQTILDATGQTSRYSQIYAQYKMRPASPASACIWRRWSGCSAA